MKRLFAIVLLWTTLLLPMAGCAFGPDDGGETVTVTDLLGRSVAVPTEIRRVACIGGGALRLYAYIGDVSLLCGVEDCEKSYLISARPYQMVNEELFQSLPSLGRGGPQGAPDAEAILLTRPDVIFSLYTSDASAMDQLQAATGIPVVTLSYGSTEAFDARLLASLSLMGKILGREDRAAEVVGFIRELTADLSLRTTSVPESEKKSVYLGCQSNYGTHGIGSSTANYSLFNAIHAKNVLDGAGYVGYQSSVDPEALLTLDPDVIILDAGGLGNLKSDWAKQKEVLSLLTAFRTGEIYVMLPYNAYYTNLEIAYANAYFAGTVLFPEQFSDVDPEAKFREISTRLLGEDCYDAVVAAVGAGYGKVPGGVVE